MISARNRRPRLSGSRGVLMVAGCCVMLSCAAPRSATRKPSAEVPVAGKEDKVRVYDPSTDSYILVPREALRVDTIDWIEDPVPPLVTDEDMGTGKIPPLETDISKGFDIAILMPFDAAQADLSADRQDPRLWRFIQYYAGMMLAARQLDSLGIPVRIHSFDAGHTATTVESLLRQPQMKEAEIIIGPYEKEDIEATAGFGMQHGKVVISPWVPAFTPASPHPHFIQIYPGLATHAHATMAYIKQAMPGKKVYVVARDKPSEVSRTRLFTQFGGDGIEELIIRDGSPDLGQTNLHGLLDDDHGTVFILPYYSKADEGFVNAFMRKLHADKDTREAIVFGLPQWVGFSNLNANYMESLSLHLSISSFTDVQHPDYDLFRRRFFQTYHTIPDQNAFQGFDLIRWIGHTVSRKGIQGLTNADSMMPDGLATGFDIQQVGQSEEDNTSGLNAPLFLENKMIRIVKFIEQDYILVR